MNHTAIYINNMSWDANGNITTLSIPGQRMSRNMCWDEENRLAVVRDPQQLSHYIYNAGGERVWKLTGAIERMSVNGEDFIDQAILEKTLYTSPYMILTEREYTKHYYIESQRVTTKLGGGMANNLVNPISGTLDAIEGDVNHIADDLLNNLVAYSCAEEVVVEIEPIFPNMDELMQQDNDEEELYFYHGDHLGSSSWITDGSGNVNQYLAYMPFGESFIDQRSGNDIRFKFTGKERDSETGFDYFGARYYASGLSIWLSVDPLTDQYPSTSPYMYVLGKPTALIDPNGMNAWIPPTEAGGDWTAEAGDSPGSLARDANITQSAAEGVMRDYNTSNNNKRSSDIMVYSGDKVSVPGGNSKSSSSTGGATSSTSNTTTATPSSSTNSGTNTNPAQTISNVNTATGIVLSTSQAVIQNTAAGANFAYFISNNRAFVNGANNTFKYAPYAGLLVTTATGTYLSSSSDPATGQPYQSWGETGADIGASIGTIGIGAKYGGWWGAAAAALYVADKAAFKYYMKSVREHPEYFEGIQRGR